MTLKVHSVVQYSHDFDRCFWRHPVHQEVTSTPAVSRNVERAKTWHDLITGFRAQNFWAIGKFANRLNKRSLVDACLSRTEILGGPSYDVRKIEFRSSAEADAPSSLSHRGPIRTPWK